MELLITKEQLDEAAKKLLEVDGAFNNSLSVKLRREEIERFATIMQIIIQVTEK